MGGRAPYLLKADEPHFDDVHDSAETDLRSSELLGDANIIERKKLQPTLREMVTYVEYVVESFHPQLEPSVIAKSVTS